MSGEEKRVAGELERLAADIEKRHDQMGLQLEAEREKAFRVAERRHRELCLSMLYAASMVTDAIEGTHVANVQSADMRDWWEMVQEEAAKDGPPQNREKTGGQ